MNRAEAETVVAVALLQAGVITQRSCESAVAHAERVPVFRCQSLQTWRIPKEDEPCEVCGEPARRHGLCWRCERGKTALYHANGRRRRFFLSEED